MIENPIVFISYSWDDDAHKEWVLNLSNRLRANGVDVILDRYHLQPGVNVSVFVEDSIRKSNRIIIVLTPNYKQKADDRKGGVGREYALINTYLAGNMSKNEKVIPIIRTGSVKDSVIDFLRQYMYIDFSKDAKFESNYEILLRELYEEPEITIPELGKRPMFGEPKPREVRGTPIPNPTPQSSSKEEIKNLMGKGKIREVLDKMEGYVNEKSDNYNEVVLLKARFNTLKRQEHQGIIRPDDALIRKNQINHAILNLLDEV